MTTERDKKGFAAYCKRRGMKAVRMAKANYDKCDATSSLQDLLTDIRHACDALGLDYGCLDRTAGNHYSAERIGGEHG